MRGRERQRQRERERQTDRVRARLSERERERQTIRERDRDKELEGREQERLGRGRGDARARARPCRGGVAGRRGTPPCDCLSRGHPSRLSLPACLLPSRRGRAACVARHSGGVGPWLSVGNRLNLRLPCVFRVPCQRQAVESRLTFSLQVRIRWCRAHRSAPTSGGMASLPSASAFAGLCVRSPTRSTGAADLPRDHNWRSRRSPAHPTLVTLQYIPGVPSIPPPLPPHTHTPPPPPRPAHKGPPPQPLGRAARSSR